MNEFIMKKRLVSNSNEKKAVCHYANKDAFICGQIIKFYQS